MVTMQGFFYCHIILLILMTTSNELYQCWAFFLPFLLFVGYWWLHFLLVVLVIRLLQLLLLCDFYVTKNVYWLLLSENVVWYIVEEIGERGMVLQAYRPTSLSKGNGQIMTLTFRRGEWSCREIILGLGKQD